jgi:hypothetical protein
MHTLFSMTYRLLVWLSHATGLTYREMNCVVYYLVLPLVYCALVDRIWRRHTCKLAFALFVMVVLAVTRDFGSLCNGLFGLSVEFLSSFGEGSGAYVVASVVICVFLPGAALVALAWLAYSRRR